MKQIVLCIKIVQLIEWVKNLTIKSAAELTEVSPVMLHCSNVVSSTTISPSKGLNEGAVLQPTAETWHSFSNMHEYKYSVIACF